MWKRLSFLLLVLVPMLLVAEAPRQLKLSDVHSEMNQIFQLHPTQNAMTSHIMALALANYINYFDPHHVYLTAQDVKHFLGLQEKELQLLVQQYLRDDYSVFERLNAVIQKASLNMRDVRNKMSFNEEEANALSKELLPPLPPNAKLESKYFAQNQKELERLDTIYMARLITEELEHMRSLQESPTFTRAKEAVEYQLEQFENGYLYVNNQGIPLLPQQRESLFTFHILKAFATSLDVHTQFLSRLQTQRLTELIEKEYVGVGLNIDQEGSGFVVSGIMKGTSAEKNGKITVGDEILSIDGHAIKGMAPDEMLSLMHGKAGSAVELTLRNREKGNYNVTLVRGKVTLEEGRVDTRFQTVPGGILALLQLHGFYQGKGTVSSVNDMRAAIDALKKKGQIKGIILDLRDNPGGILSQAVGVAGLFMKCGVVAVAKDSHAKLHFFRSLNQNPLYEGPLVILTSKQTASGAEIVAEALKDYGLAIIVGDDHTFGKGSMQMVSPQSYGSKNITIGRYYTVSGMSPQLGGVKADIVVPSAPGGQGEEAVSEAMAQDSIEPSYIDQLLDVPKRETMMYQRYYLPFLQQQTNKYRKWIPELARLSAARMEKNTKYQDLLHGTPEVQEGVKKITLTRAEADKALSDMQLEEAGAITKDLIRLSQ